jgi:tripartite-type tricarboxylate transporter receptor subunit TctC
MRTRTRLSGIALACAAIAMAAAWPAVAQDYPTRPIRVVASSSAGGLSDSFIRTLSGELSKSLGQPFVVENRPGDNFNNGARACAEAPPDGTTLCVIPNEAIVYNKHLFKNLGFDPETAITPVSNLFFITQALIVNSALNVKTVPELIALSKEKPLGYFAPGPTLVLYMETLKQEQGANFVRAPFRGGADAVNAILSGAVPIALFGEGNVLSHIRAGTMAPLVMMNNIHSPNFPNVPLLSETGYKGPPSRNWDGLFTRAGTPKPIIDKLAKEIRRIASDPDFKAKQFAARSLVSAIGSPEEFARVIAEERATVPQVLKAIGLEPK